MKIVVPKLVTPDAIVFSNLTNNSIADYSDSENCAKDVLRVYNNIVYKSLVNNNQGARPDLVGSVTNWSFVTTCNKWALYDGEINTQSTNPNCIHQKINISFCDSLALLNIDAESVEVNLRFANTYSNTQTTQELVYAFNASLLDSFSIKTWEEYFFAERTFQRDLLLTNLPPMNLELEIKLSKTNGVVGLGMLVVGRQFQAGLDEYKIKSEMRSFSLVSIDEFGKVKRTNRESAKNLTVSSVAKTVDYNYITQKLAALINKDVVMQAGNGVQQSMMTYGLFGYTTSYDTHGQFSINYEAKGYI